jgi:hypothetical protein
MEVVQSNAWAGEEADIPKSRYFYGFVALSIQ